MKILIDCRPVDNFKQGRTVGGTGFYIKNLIEALSCIDGKNKYQLLLKDEKEGRVIFKNLNKNFEFISLPHSFFPQSIFYHFFLGWWVKWKIKPDLCFFPYSQSPFLFFSPLLCTVHDLAIFKNAGWFASKQWLAKNIITPLSLSRAKKIIAVSQKTKKDLLKLMPIQENKIQVIYEAADSLEKINSFQEILDKFEIRKKYILFIGTLEPRKNLVRLLKAFYRLQKEGKDIQLVLVGQKGWKYKNIFTAYQDLNLKNKVIFTGFVSEQEKQALLEKAEIFVYPSLYEGFGLPVLEAQKAGIAVICGNRGSLSEITAGSALLINPYSVDEIYKGMKKVLTDEALRSHLVKSGYENVKRFSWEKTARETLEVFKEALGLKERI